MLKLARWLFPLLGLGLLLWPGLTFWSARGGLEFLTGREARALSQVLFPLFGLYAFVLLWMQLMLGSLMPWWRRLWPKIERWHRRQGVFVFLFAVTHPLLLLIGLGLDRFWKNDFVAPSQLQFLLLGKIALILLVITVSTALLRRTTWVRAWWRQIHLLNYVTFFAVWFHSWNLGSDVQSTGLRWLWLGFGVTALAAVVWRLFGLTWARAPRSQARADNQLPGFVPVARLDQIQVGHPLCVQVQGQTVALFRLGQAVYALNNVCSHAGGSLCDGRLEGELIECPLHFSRFNVKTGEPIDGPATMPQATYRVEVRDGNVLVAVP